MFVFGEHGTSSFNIMQSNSFALFDDELVLPIEKASFGPKLVLGAVPSEFRAHRSLVISASSITLLGLQPRLCARMFEHGTGGG